MPLKLNIGAGNHKIEGFAPIDRKFGTEAYPLKYPDCSVDEIRASHVLEHFGHGETLAVLQDWVRTLKPGGLLKIAVPDLEFACKNAGHPHFEGWIMGGQTDENDFHGAIFTRDKLKTLLEKAGLENIREWKSEIQDCAALPVSLNLCGTKPAALTETFTAKPPKIAAVISCPRLGFTDFWGEAVAAFAAFGIQMRRYTGAFWDQGIQNALEDAVKADFDYIITCDYDSLFTIEDLQALIDTINADKRIHALAATQPKRGTHEPMFKGNAPRSGSEPFAVLEAHFGLTILRCDKFKTLPKPWFVHAPDKNGEYRGEDRLDADGYFWKQWTMAGNSIFVAPRIQIGHLETLVSMLNENGQHQFMSIDKWRDKRAGEAVGKFAKEFSQ